MNLKDFEKAAAVREKATEPDLKKEAVVNYLGKALNTYFVGSAPFHFNKALSKAKKVHTVPAATY